MGTRRNTGNGALMGYLAGGIGSGLVTQAAGTSEARTSRITAVGALLGAAAGAIAGHRDQGTRWVPLSLRSIRPEPIPGTRVRIRKLAPLAESTLEGVVWAVTPDSLVIAGESGDLTRLALADVRSLEWPYARKRSTLRGVGVGAALGAVAGLALGLASGSDCGPSDWLCFDREALAVAGAFAFGSLGAVTGGVIGHFTPRTVWESAAPRGHRTAIRVQPRIDRRGVGVKASVRF
jgi:hypothetical protein